MSTLTPRLDRLDKNYIINGGLDYWQRNSNLSSGSELSGYNSVDRFTITTYNTSGTRVSAAQEGDKPNNKTQKSGLLSFTSSGTATFDMSQKIESIVARDLASNTVSLSLWYKTDEFQQIRIRMWKANSQDNFGSVTSMYDQTFNITADSTWRQFKLEGVSLHADAYNGVQIIITGTSPLNGSGSRFFRYSQIMLNIGDKAADFCRAGRDLVEELQLCQRYYEILGTDIWLTNNTTLSTFNITYSVTKRATPTVTVSNSVGFTFNAATQWYGNIYGGRLQYSPAGSYYVSNFTADAEL